MTSVYFMQIFFYLTFIQPILTEIKNLFCKRDLTKTVSDTMRWNKCKCKIREKQVYEARMEYLEAQTATY